MGKLTLKAFFGLVLTASLHQVELVVAGASSSGEVKSLLQFARSIYEKTYAAHDTNSATIKNELLFDISQKANRIHRILGMWHTEDPSPEIAVLVSEMEKMGIQTGSDFLKLIQLNKDALLPYMMLQKHLNETATADAALQDIARHCITEIADKHAARNSWLILNPTQKESSRTLMMDVSEYLKGNNDRSCDRIRLAQKFIYEVYQRTMATEIVELFTLSIAFKTSEVFENSDGHYKDTMQRKYEEFEEHGNEYTTLFLTWMTNMEHDIRTCETNHH